MRGLMTTVPVTLEGTARAPRLALKLTLERTVAGVPSVAELASVIGVVTTVFELADPEGLPREAARPLAIEYPYIGPPVIALAVVDHEGASLIVGGGGGTLRGWRLSPPASASASLGRAVAEQLEVRRLSFSSPLELEILLVATPPMLGFVLHAIRLLWNFPMQLKIDKAKNRVTLMEAEMELERLQATRDADDAVEAARDAVIEAWKMIHGTLTDEAEDA